METARTSWEIALDVEGYAAIEPEIGAFLAAHEVVGRSAFVGQMVVEEIVRNLIEHTPPSADDEWARIEMRLSPTEVTVVVEDGRPPFSPLDGPELDVDTPLEGRRPGGMGLHLVRTLTDALTYERVGDRNRLTAVVAR